MNLQLEKTGPRMFGRRLAFALARRRAIGPAPAKRTITVPRSLDTESSTKPAEGKLPQP